MADTDILGNAMPTGVYKPRAELPGVSAEHRQADLETQSDRTSCVLDFFLLITNSVDFAGGQKKGFLCMNM